MNLLLKYHVPKVSNFLQEHDISPELYSTSWFLTMYATKVNSIDLLYLLWELIVRENDSIFPCYLGVALLEKYSNEILGKEYALIPLALNKISINSKSEIYQLVDRSKEFKQYLPVSTSTKLKNYDIFNLKNIDSYTAALAKSTCLSILPREILHLTYPETKICNCENVCDLCKNAYPIVIIDCRSKEMQDQGYFPNTEFFSENLTRNPNAIMEFVSRFEEIKGIYHFALLGSEDVKYDNQGQESGNTITQLIRGFLALEFPHISVVEGGFSSCHEFAMHYKLQIKGHLPSNCDLCKKQAKVLGKKQKNVEKKIQEDLREKIRITNTMQTFECKKYDKKLKGNLPENFLFVISFEHAFLADSERNICEKFELKELVKITKVNHSNKTLIFYFANVKEKKSYSFLNKKKAEECRQKVSVAFRSLKNGMLSDFV